MDAQLLRKRVGSTVKEHRQRRHVTLQDVASRVDVSPSTISMIERGVNVPSLPLAIALADLFGVTLDELVRGPLPEENQEPVIA